jgi:hypothetical protein
MIYTDLRAATPAEIDTVLAELDYKRWVADTRSRDHDKIARAYASGRRSFSGRPDPEAAAKHEALSQEYYEQAQVLRGEMAPYEAEFDRRGGWSRAFLVITSGQGHVHSSQRCHTCYITTQFNWVTEFSGHDEAEIVEAAGERACTICYPSAPVEVLARPTKIFSQDEREKLAAREAREAKRAEKAAAEIRDPDTGKLLFKTERGATNEIAQKLDAWLRYGDDKYLADAAKIALAVAAKRGQDSHELWVELKGKAEVKFRKEVIKRVKHLKSIKPGHPDYWQVDPANWYDSYKRIAREEGLIGKEA